jgi:hypothetical protein
MLTKSGMQRKSSRKTRSQKDGGTVLEFIFAEESNPIVSNCEELIHIPQNLRYHGYAYVLVSRGMRSCVYQQLLEGKTVGYEVSLIKIQKETVIYGKIIKERERWAKDGDFGKTAFSCFTLDEAIDKYNQLEGPIKTYQDPNIHQDERRILCSN